MRVEKIARDKVRIFISYDDLADRGIDRNEIWQNGRKVQELFWDMMETAYVEVGFEMAGPISVEAFSMPTEGVVVIVTKVPAIMAGDRDGNDSNEDDTELEEEQNHDYAEDLEETVLAAFVYRFKEFEDVVRISHALASFHVPSSLFRYKNAYYVHIEERSVEDIYNTVWGLMQEYGEFTVTTLPMLQEYGQLVIEGTAFNTVAAKFGLA